MSWVCSRCREKDATCFCGCVPEDLLLCEKCCKEHVDKAQELVHFTMPISMYGKHMKPGFYERLEDRSGYVKAKTALLSNLAYIDNCIAQVGVEVDKVVAAAQCYKEKTVSALLVLRSTLETDINTAVEEVERTLQDDIPLLETALSVRLRECRKDIALLRLVTWEASSAPILTAILQLCHYQLQAVSGTVRLPGLQGKALRVYDLERRTTQSFALSRTFGNGGRMCVSGADTALIIGGNPSSAEVYIVKLTTGETREMDAMHLPRTGPGLVKGPTFLYVFGGEGLRACEKFGLKTKKWTCLRDMETIKWAFCPCIYLDEVYLADSNVPIEVFSMATDTFKTLPLVLSELTGCLTTVLHNDQLLFLSTHNEVAYWQVSSDYVQVTHCTCPTEQPSSQCPPCLLGRLLYYVRSDSGNLNVYDLDRGYAQLRRKGW